ncbi:TIGR00266 family protein [Defluviitalea saccharophila]|uniref:TIGR00266 family protein n=1 Tax=Defluviitalea saccharophila TaxID=879970 RepID=A0ABZ2Y483_9FIRM
MQGFKNAHEIDFQLYGDDMQFVEIELDPRESVIAEAGAMMYMEQSIQMETIFGDGSGQEQSGLMGKLLGAGKRLVTGESLFMTMFTNGGQGKQKVAFAAPYPGKIISVDLSAYEGKIICQKDAFLCAAKGVSVGIDFKRKLGAGFFGGEGFIMQKLEGDGLAFIHAGGTIVEKQLSPGETLRIDTGCLVAMTRHIDYDIQFVGGIKTAFFGGEGLFFATLKGPGTVWIQSIPFSRLADRIYSAAPRITGGRKGEGSVLDLMGGLGNLLDGD